MVCQLCNAFARLLKLQILLTMDKKSLSQMTHIIANSSSESKEWDNDFTLLWEHEMIALEKIKFL